MLWLALTAGSGLALGDEIDLNPPIMTNLIEIGKRTFQKIFEERIVKWVAGPIMV